ncbi:MAG TPA: extracellular solute-binding protein [Chloroflexota bacterium]|nr:extracellular solute-binding protein [Chloroflexota bacterium]
MAGLLAACAGPAPTPAPAAPAAKPTAEPTKPVEAAKPATSAEKVSVRVFNRGHPVNEVIKGGADEYVAAHPNVTVQWESAPPGEDLRKMLILAAAGTSPDTQWSCTPCSWIPYVHAGLAMDLNPLVKSHNYDLNQHLASAVATVTRNGKLWAMPSLAHPGYPAVIINKTMFEKGGVPIPKEEWTDGPHPGWKDWTFDAMQAAAIALTKREGGRVAQWGLQMRGPANPLWTLVAAMRAEGGDYLDKEGTKAQFNSPEGRKVIKYYAELYTKHKTAPLTADMPSGGPDLMASGRVAIRNAPTWAIATAQSLFKDFEWKILPAPRGAAGVDGFFETNMFLLMTATKQPDVAFEVMVEIVAPKWGWKSVELGGIPGSQKEFWTPDSKLTKDAGWAIFARLMNTVSPANLPANGRTEEVGQVFNAGLDPVFIGQDVDANKLIDEITPKLQAILDAKPPTIEEAAQPAK